MPRSNRLGERAAQMEATRDRIVEAAIDLYIEVEISKATLRQVGLGPMSHPARCATTSRPRQSLEEAMVERLTAEAPEGRDGDQPSARPRWISARVEQRARTAVLTLGRMVRLASTVRELLRRGVLMRSSRGSTGRSH